MAKSSISVESLIEQLHGADWTERCDAARLLGQSGDPRALDALLPDLNDPDWRVRRNAAQALGALRDQRATKPLLALLKDRTLTVRQRAIVALGRIKDPEALPALLDVLIEGKRESYDASKAIRKFGKKSLPELVKAFERSRNQDLLLMLVEMKYAGAFDFLLQLLNSEDAATRQVAVRELGTFGDKRAIPYLMALLPNADLMLQTEIAGSLGKLGAIESISGLLALLRDDELYGPDSAVYRAVTDAFQQFGGIAEEMKNAFPGSYPGMFNLGGASISLPEAMGLMGGDPSHRLQEMLNQLQTGFPKPADVPTPMANAFHQAMEDMAWKFGVMFADARDAKQERVTRLIALLHSDSYLQRAACALSLPWYGEERSLAPLEALTHDPDETVRAAAAWASAALQKVISHRKHLGM